MGKYYLEEKGHGKFKFRVAKPVSSKKARELENDNIEVFDSRKEAHDAAKEMKS